MTPHTDATAINAVAHLTVMLDGNHPVDRYRWHHVLALLESVTATRNRHHEQLLRRVVDFEGTIAIDHRHGTSHSMPPEEMLRLIAAQVLEEWGVGRRES